MNNELVNTVWIEKFRPNSFDELILEDKDKLISFLKNNSEIPSFIFYSRSPGTGKTSAAKLICQYLGCDVKVINSSLDRGIDTIREEVRQFSQSLSFKEGIKRCIFMDEFDGTTSQLQNSLRALMEEYADNVFFILTANDLSKIIEPIRSRCVTIGFENPKKSEIRDRLEYICRQEGITYDIEDLSKLVQRYYPDLRSMILKLQSFKTENKPLIIDNTIFGDILKDVIKKDAKSLYLKAYSLSSFDITAFNDWFMRYLYDNYEEVGYEKTAKISCILADVEKSANLNLKLPIIFLSSMLSISEILQKK